MPNQNSRIDVQTRRIEDFTSIMEPALHLFPADIVDDLNSCGFFTSPASTKYHGSYEGGLFEHSQHVTQILVTLTNMNGLAWNRPESPYIVGMFHDLCKIDNYRHTREGNDEWEYNPDTLLKGHGEKSVMMLSRYLKLTMEEVLCIRYHMGAFVDQKEWSDYTRAVQQYDTVLWTHHADMIATHIIEK